MIFVCDDARGTEEEEQASRVLGPGGDCNLLTWCSIRACHDSRRYIRVFHTEGKADTQLGQPQCGSMVVEQSAILALIGRGLHAAS